MSPESTRRLNQWLGVAIVVAAAVLVWLLLQRQPGETPPTTPGAVVEPAAKATTASPADESYTRGMAAWKQRTRASLEQAREAFGQAVKLDPQHARAWAGLSMTWFLLPAYGQADRADAARRSLEAAREAVRLAPGDAMAQTALGAALGVNSVVGAGSTEALAAYDLAIALDPDYATAHHWRAVALTEIDRLGDAEAGLRRALELDPDLLPARAHLALVLSLQGRWTDALAEGEEVQRRAPDDASHGARLFLAAAMADRGPEFVEPLRRWLQQAGADPALADRIVAALADPAAANEVTATLVALLDRGLPRGPLLSLLAAIGSDRAIADWFAAQPDARAGERYEASPYARMNRALADRWRARQGAAAR